MGLELRRPRPFEAAHVMGGTDLLERGHLGLAAGDALGAAGCKAASRRPFADADRDAGNPLQAPRRRVVGDGRDEAAGVRVARMSQDRGRGTFLDHAARVHHGDPVGDRADDQDVVAHVDDREARLAAQAIDLGEDPRLGDDVETGRRLVHDDDRRRADDRDGDGEPLLLTAGELVHEAPLERPVAGQIDALQHVGHRELPIGALGVVAEHLGDLVADAERWVEGGGGILRDVGDELSPRPPKRALRLREQLLVTHGDRPALDLRPRPRVCEQGEGRRRLAAARLADDPEDLAGPHRERDVLDDRRPSDELDPQLVDIEHRRCGSGRAHGSGSWERPRLRAKASPTTLTAIVNAAARMAAAATDHGWIRMAVRFSATMYAQSAAGGCNPRPRKFESCDEEKRAGEPSAGIGG